MFTAPCHGVSQTSVYETSSAGLAVLADALEPLDHLQPPVFPPSQLVLNGLGVLDATLPLVIQSRFVLLPL